MVAFAIPLKGLNHIETILCYNFNTAASGACVKKVKQNGCPFVKDVKHSLFYKVNFNKKSV